ncbi:hypothetical protein [Clostridium tertium]|uniref:hypothetical protein n=1 Tax=Clostridium tertium TaxID=1559 RepID=UPI0024B361D6|nr:hypothetical protein [Clostridium tertium]MDI9216410.1 BtrH N-terminal domain-containing protein [Clostridium tertium]
MAWLNNKIKPNNDTYPFDRINCFEKPIGIALDSFGENYSGYYYMLIKLIQSYNIKGYMIKNNKNFDMDITKKLLEDVFEIKLNNKTGDSIYSIIKEQIDRNNPVLVPANLKGLFYSKYYKESDWPHLFLIKGYNENHELYNIMDYLHLSSDEGTYRDFFISFSVMDELFGMYNSSISEKTVYYMEDVRINYNKTEKYSHDKFIDNVINLYLNLQDDQPYKELDFINQINDYIDKLKSNPISENDRNHIVTDNKLDFLTINLMNIIKYKEVFIDELLNKIPLTESCSNIKQKLLSTKKDLVNKWNITINMMLRNIYKRKKINSDDYIIETIKYEEKMKNLVKEYANINNKQSNFMEKVVLEHNDYYNYYYENNSDNIIQLINNKFFFHFNTKKLYNSWSEDNSPKVTFYYLPREYIFSVNLSVNDNSMEHSYHAGIFIRTSSDRMFFWGINSGISIRVDEVGVNPNIFDVNLVSPTLTLFIKVMDKICYFGLINVFNNEEQIIGNLSFDDSIQNIGVGCKTWGNGENLAIEFSNWIFK